MLVPRDFAGKLVNGKANAFSSSAQVRFTDSTALLALQNVILVILTLHNFAAVMLKVSVAAKRLVLPIHISMAFMPYQPVFSIPMDPR